MLHVVETEWERKDLFSESRVRRVTRWIGCTSNGKIWKSSFKNFYMLDQECFAGIPRSLGFGTIPSDSIHDVTSARQDEWITCWKKEGIRTYTYTHLRYVYIHIYIHTGKREIVMHTETRTQRNKEANTHTHEKTVIRHYILRNTCAPPLHCWYKLRSIIWLLLFTI